MGTSSVYELSELPLMTSAGRTTNSLMSGVPSLPRRTGRFSKEAGGFQVVDSCPN